MPNSTHKYSRLALVALAAGAASASGATGGCVPPLDRAASSTQAQGAPARIEPAAESNAPAPAALPSNLDDYIARPEPSFTWKEEGRAGLVTTLGVTSQEWQGTKWTHKVEIVRPAREAVPGAALVVINFGSPTPGQSFVTQLAANAANVTIVNAFNVPNQPLWDKREDDLIAHTFAKYLEQPDPHSDWPLLLPMTKSTTQIMRAVEAWSAGEAKKDNKSAAITKWGVSGASKRGWTAWLVAAAEEKARPGRVIGVIPMVYDNLNLAVQMPHQKESWGAYSEMIADYSRRGLPDIVSTPRGRELAAIIDPWTYRERLKLPKLIVNGSNDPYWPLDAFNLYRGGLSGETDVFYAPNSGHILNGNEARVAGITAAWFKMVAQNKTPPQVLARVLDARNEEINAPGQVLSASQNLKWRLQVLARDGAPVSPRKVKLWAASSATRDFRKSRWQAIELQPGMAKGSPYEIALDDARLKGEKGQGEFHAIFGEVELPGGVGEDAPVNSPLAIRVPFALSSPVTIWK